MSAWPSTSDIKIALRSWPLLIPIAGYFAFSLKVETTFDKDFSAVRMRINKRNDYSKTLEEKVDGHPKI